jgi:hypothetical protein
MKEVLSILVCATLVQIHPLALAHMFAQNKEVL